MSASDTQTSVESNSAVLEGRIVRTPGLLLELGAIFLNLPRNWVVVGDLSDIHENYFGTELADSIDAGGGHDWVLGGGGIDLLRGGTGNDTVFGGNDGWFDEIHGDAGNDVLVGGGGGDELFGGEGNDTLFGDTAELDLVMPPGSGTAAQDVEAFLRENEEIISYVKTGLEFLHAVLTGGLSAGFKFLRDFAFGWFTDLLKSALTDAALAATETQNDELYGGLGNDLMNGGAGRDTLFGGEGNDTLIGGTSLDRLEGGTGDDVYYIRYSLEDEVENLRAGIYGPIVDEVVEAANAGFDIVRSDLSYTLTAHVEGLELLGNGALTATGNALNNVIRTNAGLSTLYGLEGDDTLQGSEQTGGGNAHLYGGIGNDVYEQVRSGDVIFEQAGGGFDTLRIAVDYSLAVAAAVEVIYLIGAAGRFYGSDTANLIKANILANLINGLGGNDTIHGEGGNDSLDGGDGADLIYGGDGDDYVGTADPVAQLANNTTGRDTVYGDLGNDTLTGARGGDSLFGGEGDDLLRGHAVQASGAPVWASTLDADVLDGGAGNDTLIGGGGADTIHGGLGNDLILADYEVAIGTTAAGDLVYGGEGNDTLWGSETGDTLYGGTGQDSILGSAGADLAEGGAGNDILSGGTGADTLRGGAGDDSLTGGADADVLDGGRGNDTLGGGAGNDLLDGGGGIDLLQGGLGRDTLRASSGNATLQGGGDDDSYVLGFGSFTVVEAAGGGTDQLTMTGSVTVQGEVEQITVIDLTLSNTTQTAHFARVSGGDGASVITGATGDNWLDGEGGDDTIQGGAGNDTLRGGTGNDVLSDDGWGDTNPRSVHSVGVAVTTAGADPLRRGLDPSAGEGSVLLGSLMVGTANGGVQQLVLERTAIVFPDFSTQLGSNYTRLSHVLDGAPDFDALNLRGASDAVTGLTTSWPPSVIEAAATAQSTRIAVLTPATLSAADTNGTNDIYVRDGATWTQVNITVAGARVAGAAQLDMSTDGSTVGFVSGNRVYVAATDGSGAVGLGHGFGIKVAAAGHVVALQAPDEGAAHLAAAGRIELRDGLTGALRARMQTTDGEELNGKTTISDVSDDGRHVLFTSTATNAVASGNPAAYDNNLAAVYRDHLPTSVYLWDSVTGQVTRVSQGDTAPEDRKASWGGVFSPDGRTLAFVSADDTLTAGDSNGRADIYLLDIPTGTRTRISTLGLGETEITDAASGRALGFDTTFAFGGDIRFDAAGASVTWVANNRVYRADLTLSGGARSDDWLDGGAGADTMDGGAGADTYILDDIGDRANDSGPAPYFSGGALRNLDRAFVTRAGDYTLTMDGITLSGIEEVYLEHTGGLVVTGLVGDAGNNRLFGNAGANAIDGGAGADYIDGGIGRKNLDGSTPALSGADTLTGGAGNDTIRARLGLDTVIELDGTAGGIDTLISVGTRVFLEEDADQLAYSREHLAANVEHVEIEGTQAAYVRGSAANNRLTGNAGNDTLLGLGGLDTIAGGAGHDLIDGGAAVYGPSGSGTQGGEVLLGGAGNDTIRAAGPASIAGGDGDDLITLTEILPDAAMVGADNLLPVAVISGGAGYDRVVLTAQYDAVNFRSADVWITDAETGLARLVQNMLILSAMVAPLSGGAAQSRDFLYLFEVEQVGFTDGLNTWSGLVADLMPVAPLSPVITGRGQEASALGDVTLISTVAGPGTTIATLDARDTNAGFGETISYEFVSTTGGSTATRVALTAAQAAQAFDLSGNRLVLKDASVLQSAGALGDFRWTSSDLRDADDRSLVISIRAVDARGLTGAVQTVELALANFSNRYIHVVTGDAYTAVIQTDRRGLPSGNDTIFGQNTLDPVFGEYYGDVIHAAEGNDLIYSGGSGWRAQGTVALFDLGLVSMAGMPAYGEADAIWAGAGDDTVHALRDLTRHLDASGQELVQIGGFISGDEEGAPAHAAGYDVLYSGFSYDGGTFEEVHLTDFQGNDLIRMREILALTQQTYAVFAPHDAPLDTAMIAGGNSRDNLITGNALDNLLLGYHSAFGTLARDTLTADGNDTLYGGAGNDTLRGGNGNDSLFGGEGDDLITTDGAGIAVMEGGAGDDHLRAYGNGSTLYGGAGNDTLGDFGGLEPGSLRDGSGLVTSYYGGDGNDHVIDIPWNASLFLGTPERVWADLGNGDDRIDLLATADATIFGGLGDDTYAFGHEAENMGNLLGGRTGAIGTWQLTDTGGHDSVIITSGMVDGTSTLDLTGFEVLDSQLINARFRFGAEANDITVAGALLVEAGAGNDTITAMGPQGFETVAQMQAASLAVTLQGGLGDDLYRLQHHTAASLAALTITETGSGTDTVELVGLSLLDYTLGAGLEHLALTNSGVQGAAYGGNGQVLDLWGDQAFSGNAAANRITLDDYSVGRLYGLEGNDTISGGLYNDGLFGGAGDDLLEAGSGNDTVEGGAGNDVLDGGLGLDTLRIARTPAQIAVTDMGDGRYRVTDLAGDLGTDTVSGFERVDLNGTVYDFAELVPTAATGLRLGFAHVVDWSDYHYVSAHVSPDFASLTTSSDGPYYQLSQTVLLPKFHHGQGESTVGVVTIDDINARAGDSWTLSFADATGVVTGPGAARGWTVTALDATLAAALFDFDGQTLRLRADADFAALEAATRAAQPNWDTAYESNGLEGSAYLDDPDYATNTDLNAAWVNRNPNRPITLQIGVSVTDSAGLTTIRMIELDYQRPVISLNGEQTGLRGTFGMDTLVGGTGDDTILGDSDGFSDQGVTSAGAETWHASHRTDDHLTGGAGNDVLFGDLRAHSGYLIHPDGTTDLWYGLVPYAVGDDTLDGGTGADTMYGGFGNDVYYVDNAGDVVVDRRSDGGNEIRASVSYAMGDQAEVLRLIGTAREGRGGDFADAIHGNASDNLLRGGGGDDTLDGGAGFDTLHGGAGDDLLIGGDGRDLAVYEARIGDVELTDLGGGSWTIRDLRADTVAGFFGTDTLQGVELLSLDGAVGTLAAAAATTLPGVELIGLGQYRAPVFGVQSLAGDVIGRVVLQPTGSFFPMDPTYALSGALAAAFRLEGDLLVMRDPSLLVAGQELVLSITVTAGVRSQTTEIRVTVGTGGGVKATSGISSGTVGSDTIEGGEGADSLLGGEGDDLLTDGGTLPEAAVISSTRGILAGYPDGWVAVLGHQLAGIGDISVTTVQGLGGRPNPGTLLEESTRQLWLTDALSGRSTLVSRAADGSANDADAQLLGLSSDGRYVLYQTAATNIGPSGAGMDVFRFDRLSGLTEIVTTTASISSGQDPSLGGQNGAMSANGGFVVFESAAAGYGGGTGTLAAAQVWLRDMGTGTITLVSDGATAGASGARISADGRYVVFASATDLAGGAAGTTDLYRWDRQTGTTELVSANAAGAAASAQATGASLSGDGRFVLFASAAQNLGGGLAGTTDIFRKDMLTGTVLLVSTAAYGAADGDSRNGVLSADGRYAAFETRATNLVSGASSSDWKLVVRDLWTGVTALVSTDADLDYSPLTAAHAAFSTDSTRLTWTAGAEGKSVALAALLAELPDDTLDGGAGNDTLAAGAGQDLLFGGTGNDRLSGEDGHDWLEGGSGDDTLYGGGGTDSLFGGDGNDLLNLGEGGAQANGGTGQDTLRIDADWADLWISGTASLITVQHAAQPFGQITGPLGTFDVAGVETFDLNGTVGSALAAVKQAASDITPASTVMVRAAEAGDIVATFAVTDPNAVFGDVQTLSFGSASGGLSDYDAAALFEIDGLSLRLKSGASLDMTGSLTLRLFATGLDGLVFAKDITFTLRDGYDLTGTAGNDTLTGAGSPDTLRGGDGDDLVQGLGGNDLLWGDGGADTLLGGAGDDSLTAGGGTDLLIGGAGNDTLVGNGWRAEGGSVIAHFEGDWWHYAFEWLNGGATLRVTDTRDATVPGHTGVDLVTGVDLISFGAVPGEWGWMFDTTIELFPVAPSELRVTGTHVGGAVGSVVGELSVIDGNMFLGDTPDFAFADTLGGLSAAQAAQLFDLVKTTYFRTELRVKDAGAAALIDGQTQLTLVATGKDGLSISRTITLTSERNNLLTGTAGADLLDGGTGNDTLQGLAGDDTLIGGVGNDVIQGGAGAGDLAVYTTAWTNLRVEVAGGGYSVTDLRAASAPGQLGVDSLTGVELLRIGGRTGAIGDAVAQAATAIALTGEPLAGDAPAGTVAGVLSVTDANAVFGDVNSLELADVAGGLSAGAAAHLFRIVTEDGIARLVVQAGVNLASGPDSYTIGLRATGLDGLTYSQTVTVAVNTGLALTGTPGPDTLTGGWGNDTLTGAEGNDLLEGGRGNDRILGGQGGADTAVYATAWQNLSVAQGSGSTWQVTDLRDPATPGHLGQDTLTGVELLTIDGRTGTIAAAVSAAPTAVQAGTTNFGQTIATGSTITTLTAVDANAVFGDAASFRLVDAVGGLTAAQAQAMFAISGNALRYVGSNPLAHGNAMTIAIEATDSRGLSFVQQLVMTVDRVNTHLPVTGHDYAEGGEAEILAVNVLENDTDDDPADPLSLSLAPGKAPVITHIELLTDDGFQTITASTGTLRLRGFEVTGAHLMDLVTAGFSAAADGTLRFVTPTLLQDYLVARIGEWNSVYGPNVLLPRQLFVHFEYTVEDSFGATSATPGAGYFAVNGSDQWLVDTSGDDVLRPDMGSLVRLTGGTDTLYLADAANLVQITGGVATVYGGEARDAIRVAAGSAFVEGGGGNDDLTGETTGQLRLSGGAGDDFILAMGGANQTLEGGAGDDSLFLLANTGSTLVYSGVTWADLRVEHDRITDLRAVGTPGHLGSDTLLRRGGERLVIGGHEGAYDDAIAQAATAIAVDVVSAGLTLQRGDTVGAIRITDANAAFGDRHVVTFASASGGLSATEAAALFRIVDKAAGPRLVVLDAEGVAALAQPIRLALTATGLDGLSLTRTLDLTLSTGAIRGTGANEELAGGIAADRIYGEGGDDSLLGRAGNDTLFGGAGNDTLNGGAGDDRMVGGIGNDSYRVDSRRDLVIEIAGEGHDTIHALSDVQLDDTQHVEVLIVDGPLRHAFLGGNLLDNLLIGDAGNDTLSGGGGNDLLRGRDGNDVLSGGTGDDTLIGGLGNDTYVIDSPGDVVIEGRDAGTDRILTSISYTLDPSIRVEHLIAAADLGQGLVLVGNGLANRIQGTDHADTLAGGNGRDTLVGGAGDDLLIGGRDADRFVLRSGAGHDRIADFDGQSGDRFVLEPGWQFTVVMQMDADLDGAADDIRLTYQAGSVTILNGPTALALEDWNAFIL